MASLAFNYAISGPRPFSYHWLNLLFHVANTALVFFFIRKLSGGGLWTSIVTAFFYLAALIVYLRYLDLRKPAWLGITWILFALSVASKPAAVVLPLTLLATDWFRRREWSPGLWLEKIPFLVVSGAMGLLTVTAQSAAGAVAAPQPWTLVQKILFASYGTVMYVVKLFLPFGLSAIYPYPTR